MSDLSISKSVRLPEYLVEFIEQYQEGDNFSQKLMAILLEFRDGYDERQRMIESYRKNIAYYRELYNRLITDYGEARRIIIHMHKYLDDMKQLADKASVAPEPEDPDLLPGNMPFT